MVVTSLKVTLFFFYSISFSQLMNNGTCHDKETNPLFRYLAKKKRILQLLGVDVDVGRKQLEQEISQIYVFGQN